MVEPSEELAALAENPSFTWWITVARKSNCIESGAVFWLLSAPSDTVTHT